MAGIDGILCGTDAEKEGFGPFDQDAFKVTDLKAKGILTGPKKPLYIDDGAEVSYDTPSGKVEVSGPNSSPSGRTWALSSSWTTPATRTSS